MQLFGLQSDAEEMRNLALEPVKNREAILRMNALLNDLIDKEGRQRRRAVSYEIHWA